MRKENKLKKALELNKQDFENDSKGKGARSVYRMLETPIYEFYVKKSLYEAGKLSYEGFLNNDNVYDLRLGKKDSSGAILLSNAIIDVYERYLFSIKLFEAGDIVTSFFVDHDDDFYAFITDKRKKTTDEVNFEFEVTYRKMSNAILAYQSNMYMNKEDDKKSAEK